jgi:plastocyanin
MTKRRLLSLLLMTTAAACGGGGGPTDPSPAPSNPNRITISASGAVSPTELIVPPGTRVLFVNNHARRHDMTSDQHPDHMDCPEINQVGVLQPGQNRETGNLVSVRTCGFHDHENPDDPLLKGRIVIR